MARKKQPKTPSPPSEYDLKLAKWHRDLRNMTQVELVSSVDSAIDRMRSYGWSLEAMTVEEVLRRYIELRRNI